LILAHLLDDRIWRKALEHYTRLNIPVSDSSNNKIQIENLEAQKLETMASPVPLNKIRRRSVQQTFTEKEEQTKQINYKKTYFEIDFNVHLMDMAASLLRVESKVYMSQLCRILAASMWIRVPLFNCIISGSQYTRFSALTLLLAMETYRVIATIYAYLKYKYLKNIICLLMEVSQGVSLTVFYVMCLFLSPKRFDEIIMDFYQDAGIWIVIASCVAEYLLLITYIAVAAYEYFKNRK